MKSGKCPSQVDQSSRCRISVKDFLLLPPHSDITLYWRMAGRWRWISDLRIYLKSLFRPPELLMAAAQLDEESQDASSQNPHDAESRRASLGFSSVVWFSGFSTAERGRGRPVLPSETSTQLVINEGPSDCLGTMCTFHSCCIFME